MKRGKSSQGLDRGWLPKDQYQPRHIQQRPSYTDTVSYQLGQPNTGASTNYTLYIKSTGTVRQTLNISTSNWTPTNAAQYITVTWDQNSTSIAASQVVKATLILTVSASIDSSITTFSNSITITGTS